MSSNQGNEHKPQQSGSSANQGGGQSDENIPIDCELALNQISEFIDRELTADDRAAMDKHVHTCRSCFSRVEFERLLKSKVGELLDQDATPRLTSRIKNLFKDF